jgi:hypothetical protein
VIAIRNHIAFLVIFLSPRDEFPSGGGYRKALGGNRSHADGFQSPILVLFGNRKADIDNRKNRENECLQNRFEDVKA